MNKKISNLIVTSWMFLVTVPFLLGEIKIIPLDQQTSMKWGKLSEGNGIRKVESTEAEYNSHNRHGPITYYHVPFSKGTFSLSWKHNLTKKVVLVFETEVNGKPSHLFKVFINGTPAKNSTKSDVISFVTYKSIPGSKKKKVNVTTEKYHAEVGEWHETSVTLSDDLATIRIDDRSFTVKDESLRNKVIKCGINHKWGTLETKDVIIVKN